MSKKTFSISNSPLTNVDIEETLSAFRPSPSQKIYQWAGQEGWKDKSWFAQQPMKNHHQWKVLRVSGVLGFAFLLVVIFLSNIWGQSDAHPILKYFQYAISPQRTEVPTISFNSTPDPRYPYNLYPLSFQQVQIVAGFELKFAQNLPAGVQFHGARHDPVLNQVVFLFTYHPPQDSKNWISPTWIYVTQQLAEFQQDWGVCPSGSIKEVDVAGIFAEMAEGITWMTDQQPMPGVERKWVCLGGGNSVSLRWKEKDVYVEILASQPAEDQERYFTQEKLIDFAKLFVND